MADYQMSSPTDICDIPQNYMEPILFGAACARGTRARLSTEYLHHEQDADGVTVTARDRVSGETFRIRAKYLIGADGGNSMVAEHEGLPYEGQMGVAGSMNIVFKADLSRYVAHRPGVLYWVMQPGSDVGGIGMGLVRMVRPWDEWLIVWGYDIEQGVPEVDDDFAVSVVHNLVGDDTLDVEIQQTSVWTVNNCYATTISKGRVFCVGDAIHRHPPSNGLGSNTSMQDSYNLAWKLAMVLEGHAGEGLLESYQDERAPVAKQIVTRANQSIEEFGPIFEALGLTDTNDPDEMRANMEARKGDTPEASRQREALREAIRFKNYEFNCHGVEMNHRYTSSAIVPDGTPVPEWRRDRELYYQACSRPGARIPHVWVQRGTERLSTLDLVGQGRFTVVTGIGGEDWVEAARAIADETGIPVEAVTIGPGRDVIDVYGEWASVREVSDGGCLLVRPDQHVAFRQKLAAADAASAKEALMGALDSILSREALTDS